MSQHERTGGPDSFEIGFGSLAAAAALLFLAAVAVPSLRDSPWLALAPFAVGIVFWFVSFLRR